MEDSPYHSLFGEELKDFYNIQRRSTVVNKLVDSCSKYQFAFSKTSQNDCLIVYELATLLCAETNMDDIVYENWDKGRMEYIKQFSLKLIRHENQTWNQTVHRWIDIKKKIIQSQFSKFKPKILDSNSVNCPCCAVS